MSGGKVKIIVTLLYYCRFAILAVLLYGSYVQFGPQFIGGSLGGMLVYKIFLVGGNIKEFFHKSK